MRGYRLAGKRALITGGGSGIGRAIAVRLGQEGAGLAVADIRAESAEATATRIREAGGASLALTTDVSDAAQASALIERTVAEFGGLDILVNNAGIELAGDLAQTAEADFDRVMAVNLKGTYLVSRAALPHLLSSRGVILNIGSELGLIGYPPMTIYAASKAAVISLTKSTARRYAAEGLRVNCLCPGGTDTPLLQRLIAAAPDPEAERRAAVEFVPMHRLGRPEEIAAVAAFLVSDEASFITGAILAADGGTVA